MRRVYVLALPIAMGITACSSGRDTLPFYLTRELTPEWISTERATELATHRVDEFRLMSSNGIQITEKDLDGRVSVVHFFFTECNGVCPKTQPNLKWLLKQLPSTQDLQVLSQSVKPEADSIGALRSYATDHGITDPRWMLLTGSRKEIEKLAADSYYANLTDGRSYGVNDLAHTETVYLVDRHRRIRGVYNGTLRLDMEQLRDDIRSLETE